MNLFKNHIGGVVHLYYTFEHLKRRLSNILQKIDLKNNIYIY